MKHERLHNPSALENLQNLVRGLDENKGRIEKALRYSHGTHTFDDVVLMVLHGRLLFIPLENSFLILEVMEYPQIKTLHVFLAGGNLREILDTQDMLFDIARQNGCTALSMTGRQGWKKPLGTLGWRETSRTFERVVPQPTEH